MRVSHSYRVLQGVEEAEVAAEVERVLARVALPAEMAARAAGQYSGGSRRKLALGIALVGGVDAVLLDEPSSGMVSLFRLLLHMRVPCNTFLCAFIARNLPLFSPLFSRSVPSACLAHLFWVLRLPTAKLRRYGQLTSSWLRKDTV